MGFSIDTGGPAMGAMATSASRFKSAALQAPATPPQFPETDKATISEAALRQSSEPVGGWRERLIANADAHPEDGDQFLKDYTSATNDGPLLDISDLPHLKLTSTGETWTPESQQKYEAASKLVRQARADLYASEKGKGTPPADIMQKLFAYNDALPQWYKDGMDWK